MDMLQAVFNFSTLQHMINSSTIVLLAALGCMFTDQAGMMNIGIDGMMVAGAFAAAIGSWLCGSWIMGLAFAMMTGLLFGLFFGVMVVRLKSDEFIIGVALNVFAVALTSYLLKSLFGQTGSFRPETGTIFTVPKLEFTLFGQDVKLSLMVIISWLLVAVTWVLLYRTPLGFWLHASGEHP